MKLYEFDRFEQEYDYPDPPNDLDYILSLHEIDTADLQARYDWINENVPDSLETEDYAMEMQYIAEIRDLVKATFPHDPDAWGQYFFISEKQKELDIEASKGYLKEENFKSLDFAGKTVYYIDDFGGCMI